MPSYQMDISVIGHDKASGVFRGVAGSLGRIMEIAGGILTSRLIVGVGEAIGQIATKSLDATAQLQQMTISLESLASRELVRASDGMLTLAQVEGQAGDMAKEMIDKLARMSIISPYANEVVQSTFRLNTAFGYTFKEAERMTEGLLNLAAGVGADNEQLNRMAYNFAQIRLQGKVTAADIRQLALAGFDLRDVLKSVSEQMGYNIEDHLDFNALVAEGKITWEQFSVEFAKYAEKNFGGAAEKMSRTLMGLKSTFGDVFVHTMPKIIGGAVEKVTGTLGKLLDIFLKVRDTDFLDKLGASVTKSAERFMKPIDRMVDRIGKYVDVWMMAKGFVKDGLSLQEATRQLKGMQTPLEIIETTLKEVFGPKIGGLIASFVSRTVTNIGKVKEAFGELAQGDLLGAFDALGAPEGLLRFIDDIMKAVGNLQEFWDKNGGKIKDIFAELVSGILDFGGDQVNTGLEATGGFFERMTQKLVDNGPKIVEMLREAKDTILNTVLPAVDRFIDRLVNEWIPKAIEFGEYLRENWVPILTQIAVVIGVVLAAVAGFKVFAAVAGFVFTLASAIGGLMVQVGLAGGISAFIASIAAGITAFFPYLVIIVGALAAAFVGVVSAVGGFIVVATLIAKNWDKVRDVLSRIWEVISSALKPAFDALVDSFGPLMAASGELRAAFAPVLQLLGVILMPVLKVLAVILGVVLVNAIAMAAGLLTGFLNLVTGLVNTFIAVTRSLGMIISGLVDVVAGVFQLLIAIFTGDSEKISAATERIWTGIKNIVGGILGALIGTVAGLLGAILSAVAGWAAGFSSVWRGVWDAVASKTTGTMNSIATTVSNGYQKILNLANSLGSKFRAAGSAVVEGIKEGIANGWNALIEFVRNKINSLISAAMGALDAHSPSGKFEKVAGTIVAGMKKGLKAFPDVLNMGVVSPLANLPGRIPNNAFDSHDTSYYAPVYQIVQQDAGRFSTQGVG
jgi:tape measure domain-containing protein